MNKEEEERYSQLLGDFLKATLQGKLPPGTTYEYFEGEDFGGDLSFSIYVNHEDEKAIEKIEDFFKTNSENNLSNTTNKMALCTEIINTASTWSQGLIKNGELKAIHTSGCPSLFQFKFV